MEQKQRYNQIWNCGDVIKPEAWSVWEIIKDFQKTINLEIGPGNYPKIPLRGGYFLDISKAAVKNLKKLGGGAVVGDVIKLPYEKNFFDLIVAIEILEHIKDDEKAFSEITRVLKSSGFFLFSVPLKMDCYGDWDKIAGHERRYEIKDLQKKLLKNKFKILKYRHPSFYPKIIDMVADVFFLKKLLFKKSRGRKNFPVPPKLLFNLYTKVYAFLERKGAPQWRTDVENLANYQEKAIVILCQKK